MNGGRLRRAALVICLGLLAAACESGLGKTVFVVLPDADGKIGQITVEDASGENKQVLNEAYAAAHVKGGGLKSVDVEKQKINELFGKAIAAQPILPSKFTVNFQPDTDRLTDNTVTILDKVVADVQRRNAYLVEVIGHTDREAGDKYNAELSLRRATTVRQFLIDRGLQGDLITATGRGEHDPLVPTKDGVRDRRNRRVEISVR